MPRKLRYIFPFAFAAGGIGFSIYSIWMSTQGVPSFDLFPYAFPGFEGTIFTDILMLLIVAIPVLILEYFIIGLPLAVLFVIGSKLIKGATTDINIMEIGREFGGVRIINRAAAPALFAISWAGLIRSIIENAFFGTPPSIPPEIEFLWGLILTLMASLILMPIALIVFLPTWVINDAGIVTHTDRKGFKVRQPPYVEGVGRWYSNIVGGFALIAYPLSAFTNNFYDPLVMNPNVFIDDPLKILVSFLWTFGLPLMIMAFIVPVVVLNEIYHEKLTNRLIRFAKRIGADHIKMPEFEEVT
ncbi:MAG: hypothetical protein RTU30_11920 [Candidatus Thorarchaeota archaeon]